MYVDVEHTVVAGLAALQALYCSLSLLRLSPPGLTGRFKDATYAAAWSVVMMKATSFMVELGLSVFLQSSWYFIPFSKP